MQKRWRLRDSDQSSAHSLTQQNGIPPLVARVLAGRGIDTPDLAQRFISASLADLHDPFLLLDMDKAVARLAKARRSGETVCVFGDYDVDGITSVALLISFFRAVGISCFYYIPRRLEDGYGLSAEGLELAAAKGAKIVVTVDCGISAVAEAGIALSLGLDLIITDHHAVPDPLPEAFALINPHRPGCPFPFKPLAGVGVAFNLAMALRKRLREENVFVALPEPDLREYLDLVALGTIADLVPLIDENRVLVRHGLKVLATTGRIGTNALKEVAGVGSNVTCGAVGFRLAPRLNAAGRLEDAALGVELLLCDDRNAAGKMALELDQSNTERQSLEHDILQDALKMLRQRSGSRQRHSIVLASADWHPGVIGIVASRVVDLYHRPTILIALQEGAGRGSGRSIPGFHLYQALQACSDHLTKFGGHKLAAGLSIDESTLEAFVDRFDQVAAGELAETDLVPELLLDGELSPDDLHPDLVAQLLPLQPFGIGNPEPLFILPAVRVLERRVLKDSHLKLRVETAGRSVEAICFGMADRTLSDRLDLVVAVQENIWKDRKTLQLRVKDFKPAA